MARPLRALARAATGLALTAVLFAAGEGTLWLADVPVAYQRGELVRWQRRAYMHDVRLPNPALGVDFVVSTNGDGLRTPHGRGDGRRIWLAGDSTVFGWGVADAESLPAALERTLQGARAGTIQVINGGQPSASTVTAAQLAEQLAPAYGVDLMVAVLPYHDWFPAHITDREFLAGGGRGPVAGLRHALATHSRVFAGLMRLLRPDRPGVTQGLTNRVPDGDRAWALERLGALGVPLVVVTLPTPSTLGIQGFANRGAGDTAWMATTCSRLGCLPLDLSRPDEGIPPKAVFEEDTAHFTAAGNAWLAERLATGLAPVLGALR